MIQEFYRTFSRKYILSKISQAMEKLSQSIAETQASHPSSKAAGSWEENIEALVERVRSKIHELSYDKAHLTAILSNMTEGVVAVDTAGKIIEVNPSLS